MTRSKLSNALIGGFGAAGILSVYQGFLYHFTIINGIALELFLAFEFCGFLFIFIAVLIHFKY